MHQFIEPEVAGGLGGNTVMDRSSHPPRISHLHYHVEDWLGDCLIESFPVFLVTEDARNRILEAGLTGVAFSEAEVSFSSEFTQQHANVPAFVWLQPTGTAGEDDFASTSDGVLVVSQRAIDLLSGIGLSHADTSPFSSGG